MDNFTNRIAKLSPAKRNLFELALTERGRGGLAEPGIPRVHTAGPAPLSFAQQRLWFLSQLEPDSSAYNQTKAVRLSGALNVEALQKVLDAIVCRHEVLRTTFTLVDGGTPVQSVGQNRSVDFPLIDLSSCPDDKRNEELQRAITEITERRFDLSRDLMIRAALLRLAPSEHVFLLVTHHIATDGWSSDILWRELASLYAAFSTGEPDPLPELPVQYADYAVWQRSYLQGEVLEKQLSYWKKQLSGVPVLELPVDRPRPAVQSNRGARLSFAISKTVSEKLKTLSRNHGVTLFMTLLAAFQTLLHRYTGQEDIAVGSAIANRTRAEIEGLIGFFVNTLVLRTDVSGNPSFRELVGRVRKVALEAYGHQDLPFEKLVEELNPERRLGQTPLFQVMFVLQNTPRKPAEIPGLEVSPVEVSIQTAKFDLTLSMTESADSLRSTLEYNTDLFEEATIRRMAGHFQILLQDIAANPDRRISELSLLTEAERAQLLVDWNDTRRDYPKDKCVHELFQAQVERAPDALAVSFENRRLTYGELNARANQLAHHLKKLGVGPEVLVGICVERSLELVIGVLAVLKAGGAYLPLDPAYPKDRLAFMLEDAGVPVLLSRGQLVENLPDIHPRVVCLDRDWDTIAAESEENPESGAGSDNLAYVIYTSGSTGKPKGVEIQHAAVVNLVTWHQRAYGVSSADRATQLASPAFDASVWELWPYITAGASIDIPDEETVALPSKFLRWLAARAITICFLPTPLAASVLAEPRPEGLALRALLTGGDKLHRSSREALPFCLANNYGPTENTVVTTWTPVATGSTETEVPPPIGRPVANTQVYLLDSHFRPVPIGVAGELYIGGDGLARGYWNHPELTAEKFIPNPFSGEPGARLYKTGDLARYLPDGNIEFLGRVDHQVKIRGFRIEPGEIEAVLGRHPAVRQTLVLLHEDIDGKKRLVAYVVPSQESKPTITDLRSFLTQKLPDYMVPSSFVFLEALPLTPNGKVDRRALPPPDQSRPELGQAFIAPRTPVEEVLAGIWAEVLKLEKVGIRDNFFELGGDSILSIQIVARASKAGLQLTPNHIFQHQTIAELALVAGTARTIETEQGVVTGRVSLTPVQRWFFEQNLADAHQWNMAMLLEMRQALDPVLLEKAVQHLLLHHDALRLRFTQDESGWQQFNAGHEEGMLFSRVDFSTLPESEHGPAIEAAAAKLQSGLSLADGPLMRVVLFDLGAHKPGRLLLVIHHLAVDGVSWRILLEDLQTAYRQLSKGESVHLPPKTTSFKHWAERLTEYSQSPVLQKELDYWLAQPWTRCSPLPRDFPEGRSCNTVASGRTVSVGLSVEETRALLQEVPAAYHTQINDVLLTALVQTFSAWTGRNSLLIDLEGHGREEIFEGVDLSRTLGWFTTIFPVLLDLGEACDPGAALKSIKEHLRRIPNRGIGYGMLHYLNGNPGIVASLRGLPAPEVSFNYLGQFDQVLPETSVFTWTRESSGPTRSLRGSRSHLLDINGSIRGGQLRLTWSYSDSVHRHATIEGLAESFLKALRSLMDHCRSPEGGGHTPSDFPLADLNQKELDEITADLGRTEGQE